MNSPVPSDPRLRPVAGAGECCVGGNRIFAARRGHPGPRALAPSSSSSAPSPSSSSSSAVATAAPDRATAPADREAPPARLSGRTPPPAPAAPTAPPPRPPPPPPPWDRRGTARLGQSGEPSTNARRTHSPSGPPWHCPAWTVGRTHHHARRTHSPRDRPPSRGFAALDCVQPAAAFMQATLLP